MFLWKSCLIDTFNPCAVLGGYVGVFHAWIRYLAWHFVYHFYHFVTILYHFVPCFTILSLCYETVFWLTHLTRARCLACLGKIPRVTIPFVPETWCNNGRLEGHRRRPWGVTQLRNLLPFQNASSILQWCKFSAASVSQSGSRRVGSSAFWLRCLFTLPQNYSWSKNHYCPSSSSINSQTDQIKITTEVAKEGTGPGQGGFAVD